MAWQFPQVQTMALESWQYTNQISELCHVTKVKCNRVMHLSITFTPIPLIALL